MHPRRQQLGRRRDGAPLVPVRVEGGGEARDAGVLAQGGEDAVLPGGVDVDQVRLLTTSVISASRSSVLDMDGGRVLADLGVLQEERLLVLADVPRLGHLGPAVDRLELVAPDAPAEEAAERPGLHGLPGDAAVLLELHTVLDME